jgi:NADPH-dependent 2,4-dienoyl-CoA reductase/sulfur reductase-like enzyme
MPDYQYLIIGGGMTADAAVEGIRQKDPNGTIGLISAEPDPPYNRPPLTKSLWKGEAFDSIWRGTANRHVDLHLNLTVTAIDIWRRRVTDADGRHYGFSKLLLATGGRPRRFAFESNDVLYFRTAADYRHLRQLTETNQRFAVIGGGFIGSELAAALAMNHKEVVMLFPGNGVCSRLFPHELSQFLNRYYQGKGVKLLPNESVTSITRHDRQLTLRTESGKEIPVDSVVAGLGIEPNVELAEAAGIRIENGIVVDEFLRTSHPDVFAAGDIAYFYNPALAQRMRVEHEDNANTMGRCAGYNMAGEPQPYHHLPFFYSDVFDLGYEAVGELNSELQTTADWKEPFHEGVIYYLREGNLRGVLMWNLFGLVDAARQLISSRRTFRPEELKQELLKAA